MILMEFGEYCDDVPRDAMFAARLAGTTAEDCGPCTQAGSLYNIGRSGVTVREALDSVGSLHDPAKFAH